MTPEILHRGEKVASKYETGKKTEEKMNKKWTKLIISELQIKLYVFHEIKQYHYEIIKNY